MAKTSGSILPKGRTVEEIEREISRLEKEKAEALKIEAKKIEIVLVAIDPKDGYEDSYFPDDDKGEVAAKKASKRGKFTQAFVVKDEEDGEYYFATEECVKLLSKKAKRR